MGFPPSLWVIHSQTTAKLNPWNTQYRYLHFYDNKIHMEGFYDMH